MHSKLDRVIARPGAVLKSTHPRSRGILLLSPFFRFDRPKISALVPMLAGGLALFVLPSARAQSPSFNYAEALQKSLYFFDVEKSGPGVTGGRVPWRGDSELADTRVPLVPSVRSVGTSLSQNFINAHRAGLDPDGDGQVNVSGGFHDAGDHVRMGLSQAYAASTLAWAFFEFRDAFVQTEQRDHVIKDLRWFADCFLRSTFRDPSGNVVAFCYQVGSLSLDGSYWGPPELQSETSYPRPAIFATEDVPGSDKVGAHAAALAAIAVALQSVDVPYAARCTDTARALYRFALDHRGLAPQDGATWSVADEDDLSWAAVWLWEATGDSQYLNDIEKLDGLGNYSGFLKNIMARPDSDRWNIWTHSAGDVWSGVFLRLAEITHNPRYLTHAQWNTEYWLGLHEDPNGWNGLKSTPAGFRVLSNWIPNSYNCGAQLCALVLRKLTGRIEFADWARGQMNYIMGINPLNRSYIVGFPTPSAAVQHPHHRASHVSATNNIQEPLTHRHILWGALVGGPDYNDNHDDSTTNFITSEVGIENNANLVGALAGLYTYFGAGQKPLANFPPAESNEPYFAEVKLGSEITETTVAVRAHAEPAPPKFERGLSTRYFFDISELLSAGQSIADVSVGFYSIAGTPLPANRPVLRGPLPWDGDSVYYVELDWSGPEIYGTREFQFIVRSKADSQGRVNWNPSNDWSYQGVTPSYAARSNLPVYRNRVLAFGVEPPLTLTPNYSVWANPGTRNLRPGGSATVTLSLLRTHGFRGPVTLTLSGLPSGVTASIAPVTTTSASATLTLSASNAATLGVTTVTINSSGSPGSRSATLRLNVGTYGKVGSN